MEAPPLIPERGEQFLPPPEGSSTFLDALIRSATHSEAQVFTEATPPFKICHANNAWSLLCGYSVPEVLGKTCKILQGPETDPDRLRDLHAGIAANCKTVTTVRFWNANTHQSRIVHITVVFDGKRGGPVVLSGAWRDLLLSDFSGDRREITLLIAESPRIRVAFASASSTPNSGLTSKESSSSSAPTSAAGSA